MSKIKAKNFAILIVVGTWLLVTVSACENSKHAEIMSTEDLRAQAQVATAPDTDTGSTQGGMPFEGQSIDQELPGLSEPLVFAPEPPPSPASPPSDEEPVAEPKEVVQAQEPAPAPVLPEGYSESPRVERSPASDYVPDSPPRVFQDARIREFGAAEPMQVTKLEPSNFVPQAPVPEPEKKRDEAVVDLGLADVFFDFNQSTIPSGAVSILEKNAELLKQTHTNSSVLIEGHCDERGTGEYNLELGKRRAQAVKDYLVDLGIEESRIHITSYGKEKPFCTGSTSSCWQQNRRGHFVQQVLQTFLSK